MCTQEGDLIVVNIPVNKIGQRDIEKRMEQRGIRIKHRPKNMKRARMLSNTVIYRIVIYKALCFDVAQGRINGAPNETRITHVGLLVLLVNRYTTRGAHSHIQYTFVR